MYKAFLSHSSKDKDLYIRYIADKIGKDRCVYDEYTFRPGMRTLDEIFRTLDQTDIFVLFISNHSLDSDWVKTEITEASKKVINGKGHFLPIIIDGNVKFSDPRIPNFLKDDYNLQFISRPSIAYKIILQKMREISWIRHPILDKRENLFVGRHDLQERIEERLDNLSLPSLTAIFAMGINHIGRRALLINSIVKSNIKPRSYRPTEITLERGESVEDYIVKIYTLSMTKPYDIGNLTFKSMEEKIDLAIQITEEIVDHDELIFIEDNSSIISYLDDSLTISEWFVQLLKRLQLKNKLCICLRSTLRISFIPEAIRDIVLSINVGELSRTEREGLLSRYAKIRELEVDRSDLTFFTSVLTGFPEQVFYAVELIKERGLQRAKSETHLIIDYSSQKIINLLNKLARDGKEIELISLIAGFDFISFDFLFRILHEQRIEKEAINSLIENSILEVFGKNSEFIRVNEAIRDYVLRQNNSLTSENKKILSEQVLALTKDNNLFELDSSEVFITIKESLIAGYEIDPKYLIPSHFIKTVSEFYHRRRKYAEVIQLADQILSKPTNTLDSKIKRELQYYLCLSLARLSDPRFLDIVQEIQGADHQFLMGFYYRQRGNYPEALNRLLKAVSMRGNYNMAKRELVQVYIRLEDYSAGLVIAKENYQYYKNNPYNIQGYFSCLIKMPHSKENSETLLQLTERLNQIQTDVADEMYLVLKAQYESVYNRDFTTAKHYIEEAIRRFPDSNYPYLMLFDVAEKFSELPSMEHAMSKLGSKVSKKSHLYKSVITRRSFLEAHRGNKSNALKMITQELSDMPKEYIDKFSSYIESIGKN